MFTNNYVSYRNMRFSYDEGYFTDYTGTERHANSNPRYTGGNPAWWPDLGWLMRRGLCAELNTFTSSDDIKNGKWCGIYFGTGSTPATMNDYKLESLITSGLSITNCGYRLGGADGQYTATASYVLENTTSAEINIWEIGAFSVMGASSTYYPTLFERTVLTEPITIPAGESKLVTYKITFNQTLNVE